MQGSGHMEEAMGGYSNVALRRSNTCYAARLPQGLRPVREQGTKEMV